MTTSKEIAIIGGGPGGLMLALLLQQHGIQATIYEREDNAASLERGGSLDIHEETGQLAIQQAGLMDAFLQKVRFEGEDFRLLNKAGTVYLDEDAEDGTGGRPEIDRGELCDLVREALRDDCIQYGYKLKQCIETTHNRIALHFENGEIVNADIVIGSDGAFSRVRSFLSDTSVSYSGLTMIELNIEQVKQRYPQLAAFHKRGKLFALDDEKGIIAQLNGNGTLKVYASLHVARDWLEQSGIDFTNSEAAKEALLQLFADWDETLKDYIRFADSTITPRRIYMLPVGFTWKRHKQITLIGDAAHVMSPFAGEGVNMALFDAYNLAMALINAPSSIEDAIATYEQTMLQYATEAAQMSNDNLRITFSPNAAQQLKDLLLSYYAEGHA